MPQGQDISVEDLIRETATKHGVPPELALAIGAQESSFNPTAVGPEIPGSTERALGTMQLLPSTAKRLGIDPSDPVQNIDGGVRYLRELLDQNQGDLSKVLATYGGVRTNTTYVPQVLEKLSRYSTTPSAQAITTTAPKSPGTVIGEAPPKPPAVDPDSFAGRHPYVSGALEAINPMTREGRRNIAGAIGGAGGAILGAPLGPLGAGTAGVLGAMTAGSAVEAGERFLGGEPEVLGPALRAGAEQGQQEALGPLFMWPVRGITNRVMASGVGKRAAEGLMAKREATATTLRDALDTASTYLRGVRGTAAEDVIRARATKRAGTAATEAEMETAVRASKGRTEQAAKTAEAPYQQILSQPPSPSSVGRQIADVIAGPAKEAKNIIGEQVERAAETGPPIDISKLKAKAQQAIEAEIRPSAEAFPRTAPEETAQGLAGAKIGMAPAEIARLEANAAAGSPVARSRLAVLQEAIASAQGEAGQETLKHPAMGVLNRILNADDIVPFSAAHQFKRDLDDAVGAAWDRSVQSRVKNITKGLRGTLREALSVHEPYNQANAAYEAIVPAYTKGIAPQLRQHLLDDPELAVRGLRGNNPTKLKLMKEILLERAPEGGGEAEGQAAWDSLRGAWTHKNIIQGGIDSISERLDKLDPDFRRLMFDDPKGQQVIANLRAIQTSYQNALQRGAAELGEITDVGKGAVTAARELGQQGIERTRASHAPHIEQAAQGVTEARRTISEARKPTVEEQAFGKSTLAQKPSVPMQMMTDVLRATLQGPASTWGGISTLRLMLRGPKSADMVTWAAYSPANTRRFVRAMNSPLPGAALADLARLAFGAGGISPLGAPPPSTAVGGPPPAPPSR